MGELRGMDFAKFAAASLLSKRLQEAGFIVSISSDIWEKDFGEAIGYFDCGEVTFERFPNHEGFHDKDDFGGEIYHLYQSRFSDCWALDGPDGRTTQTAGLADKGKLNDSRFVDSLLKGLAV